MPVDTDSNLWTESDTKSDVRQKIIGFTQRNTGTAYTAKEVCEEVLTVEGESKYCDEVGCVTMVASILEDLCSEGITERRFVEGSVYYTYKQDIYYV